MTDTNYCSLTFLRLGITERTITATSINLKQNRVLSSLASINWHNHRILCDRPVNLVESVYDFTEPCILKRVIITQIMRTGCLTVLAFILSLSLNVTVLAVII